MFNLDALRDLAKVLGADERPAYAKVCHDAIAEIKRLQTVGRGFDAAERLVHEQIAEIERLRKHVRIDEEIIDKLPKTADGVPIVPKRSYWKIIGPKGHEELIQVSVSLQCSTTDSRGWKRTYSTREAAEARGK